MEDNLKRGVIVDFFGLPGSGKSTMAHILANKLNENGYEIQEKIYCINNEYNSWKRMSIKILNTITFTIRNFSFMCELFSMFGKGAFRNYRELIKQWINVCFVLTSINQTTQKDFVIADQGIVQAAISLSVNSESADIEAVIRKLCEKVNSPVKFIYISVEIEKDLERLHQRVNGKSRVDLEKDEELKRTQLKVIQKLCYEITKSLPHTIVDNNRTYKSELTSVGNTEMLAEVMGIFESSKKKKSNSKGYSC